MKKTYIVRLTDEERDTCLAVVKKLKGTSQKVRRANILLVESITNIRGQGSRTFSCWLSRLEVGVGLPSENSKQKSIGLTRYEYYWNKIFLS